MRRTYALYIDYSDIYKQFREKFTTEYSYYGDTFSYAPFNRVYVSVDYISGFSVGFIYLLIVVCTLILLCFENEWCTCSTTFTFPFTNEQKYHK